MQAMPFSSIARRLFALILPFSALFLSQPAHAYPGGGGAFNGKGFDACTAPSTSAMAAWWSNTPWSWVGIYIGGSARACSQGNLTAAWMNTTRSQGWRHMLIWVGPQAPCTSFASRFSSTTATAYQQGKDEAVKAYNAMIALGFTNSAAGTPVVYDMEAYPNNASCRAAVKSFVNGWTDQLAVAPAQVSGVYGSACGTYLSDLATISRPPNFIWGADWDGDTHTSALSCIAGTSWSNHQRHKQYQGGHNETWGGVTINIDSSCSNGPIAPTGALNAGSVCN